MKVILIIKREFLAKVRNKAFIMMTFLSPLLMVGIFTLVTFLSHQNDDVRLKIAVIDVSDQIVSSLENSDHLFFENTTPLGFEYANQKLIQDGYAGVLLIKERVGNQAYGQVCYYSKENPSLDLTSKIEGAIEKVMTTDNLKKAHLDIDLIEQSKASVNLKLFDLSGADGMKGMNEIKMFIGGSFGYLIMMFIVIYGNMVMRSVIEEKNNRIIEVIISSVKPIQLMLGKILGTSLAGILQYLIWVILGLTLLFLAQLWIGIEANPTVGLSAAPTSGFDISRLMQELFKLPIAIILSSFIFFFIGGYLLYSSFYAAIGAVVDSETDSQQFLFPIISPLMVGLYVGFFTVINDPHGFVSILFSFIPLTSPIVMMMRIPFGVPFWQIGLSLVVLFSTFMAFVWVTSKIYRIGILMHGKKVTYKEIYKWLKQ